MASRTSSPAAGDNLTLVHGIGQAIADRLTAAGISTFAHLARATPTELAAVLEGSTSRSPQRIANERWTQHAAELAAAAPPVPADPAARRPRRRHSFTLALLVDAQSKQILSTKITDEQTRDHVSSAGWNPGSLEAFIREHAGASTPVDERAPLYGAPAGVIAITPRSGSFETAAPPPVARPETYPLARGQVPLPTFRVEHRPDHVHVRIVAGDLIVPEGTFAAVEVLGAATGSTIVLGQATVDVAPGKRTQTDIDIPIVVAARRLPVDSYATVWLIAPGTRPPGAPATIPTLNVSATLDEQTPVGRAG